MTVTSADLAQWAAHRRAVVAAVSRRVPGVDPEVATSRGLEMLCAQLLKAGGITDPVAFWSAAALGVAAEMAREEPEPAGPESPGPGAAGPATPAGRDDVATVPTRTVDFEALSSAMERLSAAEQQILWDHHVGSRPVSAIAEEIGMLPYATRRRLRRAENRLASGFAETHAGTAENVECRTARAAMHDFVRNRLMPHRRQAVEDHMVECAGCTRAFVDVRESYWMLRAAAPVLLLGAATAVRTSTAVAAGTGTITAAVTAVGGWFAGAGGRAALVVRGLLTDPVALTATVAGSLIITTAVGTGTAGNAGASTSFLETGVVSVSTPRDAPAEARGAAPGPAKADPAAAPGLTASRAPGAGGADDVPPGLAKSDGVPPGLATKDGVPPGLAKSDGVPPGLAKSDGVPPGRQKKDGTASGTGNEDGVPPGLAKKDGVPPGLAKNDGVPPGQAGKETPPGQSKKGEVAPGQAKKSEKAAGSGVSEPAEDAPSGPAGHTGVPPGQAKKGQDGGNRGHGGNHGDRWGPERDGERTRGHEQPGGGTGGERTDGRHGHDQERGHEPGSGQERSRRTSTS
ncbi:hypothetical protein [Promicromonospora sp. NPDC050880]|uniref:hypothetical protein n=1 Tax=Promicromonospora sp. NPDC050880 TaxID=3364406 RepID=UPI0037BB6C1D